MRLVAVTLLLAGCLGTRSFPCDVDTDCTGGDGGRCEAEGVCSFLDPACDSGRRFGEYGGTLGGVCTTARPLRNACVAGELRPTIGDSCAAAVCGRLASCCEASWSEACVHLADQLCDAHCGRWIAVPTLLTTHVLEWTGDNYVTRTSIEGGGDRVAWVDAQTNDRPRLAIANRGLLTIHAPGTDDDPTFAQVSAYTSPSTTIRAITAVDFDQNDTVEIGIASIGADGPRMLLLDQTEPDSTIAFEFPGEQNALAMAWGEANNDHAPDVAFGTSSKVLLMVREPEFADYGLQISSLQQGPFVDMAWGDINADGYLDLVAIGVQIIVYAAQETREINAEIALQIRPMTRPTINNVVGAVGDIDGDMRADVVVASTLGDPLGEIVVHHSWDGGTFEHVSFNAPPVVMVTLADVDGDARLDLVAALENGQLVWMKNATIDGGPIRFESALSIPEADGALFVATTNW